MTPIAAACCSLSAMLSGVSEATTYTAAQQPLYLRLLSAVIVVTLPLILHHKSVSFSKSRKAFCMSASLRLPGQPSTGVSCWAQFPYWCLCWTEHPCITDRALKVQQITFRMRITICEQPLLPDCCIQTPES